jgi:hypothetical protein
VVKSRGQDCGDVELVGYLVNVTGPVSLVLDLHIVHDRVGSSTDPTLLTNNPVQPVSVDILSKMPTTRNK